MRSTSFAATLALAAALLSLTPDRADAQGVRGGFFDGLGVGIGGLYRSLDFPLDRRVPYFAARPPVYYSMPIPRTYGRSPFAYTPFELTPEIYPTPEPVQVVNPYWESSQSGDAAPAPQKKERTVSAQDRATIAVSGGGPLTIINPFVDQPVEAAEYH